MSKKKNKSKNYPYISLGIVLTVILLGYLFYSNIFSRKATIAEIGNPSISRNSSIDPEGKTFAFINNPRHDLTEEQSKYLAENYDLVVIGYQSDPMISSANKIKSYNQNVKILLYFPTTIRQVTAKYGIDTFKESWYLHDLNNGQRIIKGGAESLERIDLTQTEYRNWAKQTVLNFLSEAPFDGAVFDNANPIGLTHDRSEWIETIGEEKLNKWNKSLISYLTDMTSMLNQTGKY